MKKILAVLFSMGSLISMPARANVLTTDFTTINSGKSGLYFDLTAHNTVTINSFVVNGAAGTWDVWSKSGTYAGFETNPAAWTELGSGTTTAGVVCGGGLMI